jgi:uridine phosphorylase
MEFYPIRMPAPKFATEPTKTQLDQWARCGVLAVEMQAASLLAFGQARNVNVAVVARVSNAIDHSGSQFDTGSHEQGLNILRALTRAGLSINDHYGTTLRSGGESDD